MVRCACERYIKYISEHLIYYESIIIRLFYIGVYLSNERNHKKSQKRLLNIGTGRCKSCIRWDKNKFLAERNS